jgi:glucosamine--fructose-6-phosphate aminotransferase (isomerizing)
MSGIVGYIGPRRAVSVLLPALRRLEYRGYDSAGLVTVDGPRLHAHKVAGRVAALEARVADARPGGTLGVAHTRWATHGRPSDANAHPHLSCDGRLAVVHNGIIDNYRELRQWLGSCGHRFRSQTDSEVIAHLIEAEWAGGLPETLRRVTAHLHGAYAVACVAVDAPGQLVATRAGNFPLVVGLGDGETWVASDVAALLPETRDVLGLEEGEVAVLGCAGARLVRADGSLAERPAVRVAGDAAAVERGGYPHFMLKEIAEQPEVIRNTMRDRMDLDSGLVRIPELGLRDRDLAGLNRLCFLASGSSWHAALVGKHLVEEFARLPVDVELASEFRYRRPVLDGRVLTVPISQSGETADTLAALRIARERGSRAIAICNVIGSSLAREADGVLYTRAGLEVGVVSTKAFTAQLTAVTLLALRLGQARGLGDPALIGATVKALAELPELMAAVLARSGDIGAIAERLAERDHSLYLGRGIHHPLALEGALKLKEIAYIHAEGGAAGEMKHGSIALIARGMPVVTVAPAGPTYDTMAATIGEVRAREGYVIAVVSEGDDVLAARTDAAIPIPPALHWVQPALVAVALQLLAYHVGVRRGADVDRPRGLTKSVTVAR